MKHNVGIVLLLLGLTGLMLCSSCFFIGHAADCDKFITGRARRCSILTNT